MSGLADGILVGSKKNAGDYDLNNLLYSGQDGYDIEIVNDGTKFIINKAQLTVTADGVEIDANSVLPDFTGSISGLVGGERWEDLGVELDSDLHFTTDADGKTAGKFAINGSLDKTLANYEIKQADSNAAALVVNKMINRRSRLIFLTCRRKVSIRMHWSILLLPSGKTGRNSKVSSGVLRTAASVTKKSRSK